MPAFRSGGPLIGTTHLKGPLSCTEGERREFARLVRQGFDGSDDGLDGRIRDAKQLAFYHGSEGTIAAIAALKAPNERFREDVFRKAGVPIGIVDCTLELGWVFVDPAHRRSGVAVDLCRQLLTRVATSGVYATTRSDNAPMIKILLSLGFERIGQPYPRRDQELVVFLRS